MNLKEDKNKAKQTKLILIKLLKISVKQYLKNGLRKNGPEEANCHAVNFLWKGTHGRELPAASRTLRQPSANSQ